MIQLIYELVHFSVLLRTIQWFLFYFWIKYRALVVAYKGIHKLAPSLVSVPPLSPTSCSFCECFTSVQLCHSVVSHSLRPHELQHTRPPCPSPTPRVHPNSCPLSQWCHLILCHPLLLLPPIPPSIRVFSNESTLHMRWTKYWSFSFSISPSNEHPGLISFRMDWLDLLAVQGTLKSLLQHHSSKASILQCSGFFTVQLSHPYMQMLTGLLNYFSNTQVPSVRTFSLRKP